MVYDSEGSVSLEAIFQSGNLYAYCMGNPVRWVDESGYSVILACLIGAGIGALAGGHIAGSVAYRSNDPNISKNWGLYASGGVVGGLVGWGAGVIATPVTVSALGTAGGAGAYTTSKFIENVQKLYEITSTHIFSATHKMDGIMKLGKNEIEIFNKLVNTVNKYSPQFVSGSNEIRTVINGIKTTIRFYVNDGKIINIDAFTGYSNRIIGKLIK